MHSKSGCHQNLLAVPQRKAPATFFSMVTFRTHSSLCRTTAYKTLKPSLGLRRSPGWCWFILRQFLKLRTCLGCWEPARGNRAANPFWESHFPRQAPELNITDSRGCFALVAKGSQMHLAALHPNLLKKPNWKQHPALIYHAIWLAAYQDPHLSLRKTQLLSN